MINRLLEGMYMPHGYCLAWEPWLVTLHAASDFLTFCSYFAIPVAIWIFVAKRPDLELRRLALLFAAFIMWCGLTHLFGLITLWYPVYELQGLVKGVTATVSVTTAFIIFPLIPKALSVPSPRELQRVNARLEAEIASHQTTLADLKAVRAELEQRVAQRTEELQQATDRFRQLFEHAPVAMVMADREGAVQQVNRAAVTMFGGARDALMGRALDALVPGVDLEPQAHPEPDDSSRQADARPADVFALRSDGEKFPVEIGLNPLPGGARSVVVSIIDISEQKRRQNHDRFVMRELSHRSKNLLAVIQGMTRQAIASSPDLKTFENSFRDRLQGLSRSQDLLVGTNWGGVPLIELVREQIAIVERSDTAAIAVEGPPIMLSPEATQTMGLAVHELVTNALKHGALASEGGKVSVWWEITPSETTPRVRLAWVETCATPLKPGERKGFGRTVLERIVPTALQGEVTLDFSASGLRWTLDAPLSGLTG